jgi:4-hydroxyphenylpyruvate dioxygenase-like putative hemolysin
MNNRAIAAIPWKFALVGATYEAGLPHTRADIIFIEPEVINSPKLLSTLIHEKVHVYQRQNPEAMEKWLTAHGYRRIATRESRQLAGLRANPDVDQWIYEDPRTGQEMAAYYTRQRPSSISEVSLTHPSFEHPYEYMAYEIAEKWSNP